MVYTIESNASSPVGSGSEQSFGLGSGTHPVSQKVSPTALPLPDRSSSRQQYDVFPPWSSGF